MINMRANIQIMCTLICPGQAIPPRISSALSTVSQHIAFSSLGKNANSHNNNRNRNNVDEFEANCECVYDSAVRVECLDRLSVQIELLFLRDEPKGVRVDCECAMPMFTI